MKQKIETAQELKDLASKWVQEFNFIQIDVLQLVAEKENTSISEYIRQEKPTFRDIAEYSELNAAQLKRKYKTIEEIEQQEPEEFISWRESSFERNYPMWNTCFEFKENKSEQVIQAAIDAGIGVVEGLGDFNQILFFSGCGYSFYGSHWIPLYLNLPWNSDIKKRCKNVKYDNM